MSKVKRILSLDGGGVRGVITAEMLKTLQMNLPDPLHTYFDIIVGTSIGSVLALSIAAGVDPVILPDMFLGDKGKAPFKKSRWRNGIFRPKYDGKGLDKVLKDQFGSFQLRDMKTDVMATAYSVTHNQAIIFKSWKHGELRARDVARASSAAPTYFPACRMMFESRSHSMVDGGIVVNNPSMTAVCELLRRDIDRKDIHVVSIGTGEQVTSVSHAKAKRWGLAQYAKPLIPIIFDADSDAVDYMAASVAGRYSRYQVECLPPNLRVLDNPKNAKYLRPYAYDFDVDMRKLARLILK